MAAYVGQQLFLSCHECPNWDWSREIGWISDASIAKVTGQRAFAKNWVGSERWIKSNKSAIFGKAKFDKICGGGKILD